VISPLALLLGGFVASEISDARSVSSLATLRHVVAERDLRWTIDPELAWVADRSVRRGLADGTAPSPAELEALLRGRGLGDPWVIPGIATGRGGGDRAADAAGRRLWQIVDRVASRPGVTHAGAAWRTDGTRWMLVALFVRRPVDWIRPVQHAGRIVVRGRVGSAVDTVEVATLGPCAGPARCRAAGVRRRVKAAGGRVAFEVERPAGAGRFVVEVVDPASRTDPVIGWWFFDRGPIEGFDWPGPPSRWLARMRALAKVPPGTTDLALSAAADRHAEMVCRRGRAAHGFGPEDDPGRRARAAGYRGRVGENVAVAATARRAFRNLLWSPSHRRLMLDAGVRRIGRAHRRREGRVCVVQLLGWTDVSKGEPLHEKP